MRNLQKSAAKALLALLQTNLNDIDSCRSSIHEARAQLEKYELAFPAEAGCEPILLVPRPLADPSRTTQAVLDGQTLWAVGIEIPSTEAGEGPDFGMIAGPLPDEQKMREYIPWKPEERTERTCLLQFVPDDRCKSVETLIVARWDLENDEWRNV